LLPPSLLIDIHPLLRQNTGIVAALTIPALYHRHQECIDTYMSFAYMNLRMYEMVYEKCFLRIRDWVMELLKDP
jgi:hypothetical protein